MDDNTKTLFIDTNGFIQVRDLKDIPWKDLFPGVRAVDVMVAPSVIDELDKHKSGTNQRRRDRARLALQMIEKASRAPDLALVLRDSPIRVRIVISTAPRFNWAEHPILDRANPDDQLVAESLSFGNGAAVFSHDTGPRIRARIARIEAYEPAADWLLPMELTDDQREIARLKRQSPNIIAGFEKFDEAKSEIRVILPIVQPLDPQQIHRFAVEYLTKHPRASFTSTSNRTMWPLGGISEGEAERYHAEYSSFEVKVRDYYANLHQRVRRAGVAAPIDYFIRNDSGVAAEGLRIEFNLEGNGSLLADRPGATGFGDLFKMPKPPEKPRSSFNYLNPSLTRFPTLQDHLEPRDPVAFYWFERPKILSKHSALQCQEFRATREFCDCIFLLPDDLPAELGLRLHVEAANLPLPVNISAKVNITERAVEWSDRVVQAILPEYVRSLM